MALELTGLLIANAGYLAVGAALLAALGMLTWPRLAVALPLGLVTVVAPSSYLALAGVPVGWSAFGVGLVVCAAGVWRTRAWQHVPSLPRIRRPGPNGWAGLAVGAVLAVLLAYASRTFATRPLIEWDAWGVWTVKARLLYVDPSIAASALRSGDYGQTPYPIGLPTVEALGFGAMGRYDPTLIGVQFVLLAISFPLALWAIMRGRARSWVTGLAALAVVGAPQILYQLLTHYADVPLGLFVGLGVAAGGAWLAGRGESWLLVCFAAFLGMAGITKSEGFLFALVGVVAFGITVAATRDRSRFRPAAYGIAGVLALIMPWRLYCSAYGLTTPDYNLSNVTNLSYLRAHTSRVGPVVRELFHQLASTDKWALLTWVILLALAAGLAAGRWRVLGFAVLWLGLSSVGLVVLYWVSNLPLASNITNTSYRTIVSLLVGGAALVPLLVFPERDEQE